ncbi:mitochondrial targeting protein [Saccharomyces pastorianus]|uniref:Mitochondrial targeting protein n=1 Tax=Saccharomyces pastorianus TaxID=27292 RepID=A0A6C1EDS2_SACPS|nr:mitochondrial targeting protein [Saccharomyces pastorianus]
MPLSEKQIDEVKTKVYYSEVDTPFNKYLDILGNATKLTESIINGRLSNDESKAEALTKENISKLKESAQLRFLGLQSSIDTKKAADENWETCQQDTLAKLENLGAKLPELKSIHSRLLLRIGKLQGLHDSVKVINREVEGLSEGRTSLVVTRSEWEKELGGDLVKFLIKKNYLKLVDSELEGGGTEERYRVYDDFSKGPKELESINTSMKLDIDKVKQEVSSYKEKWLRDAEIFGKITSIFKEELLKRDGLPNEGAGENNDDDYESDEDEERKERFKRQRSMAEMNRIQSMDEKEESGHEYDDQDDEENEDEGEGDMEMDVEESKEDTEVGGESSQQEENDRQSIGEETTRGTEDFIEDQDTISEAVEAGNDQLAEKRGGSGSDYSASSSVEEAK